MNPSEPVIEAAELNLRGNWDTIWSAISGDSDVTKLLGIFGTIIVIAAIVGFIWAKRRGDGGGGGGGNQHQGRTKFLIGALVVGTLMAAPSVILPLALGIADLVGNVGIRLFEKIF